jgi:DNA-binding NarL/FixJ family response regulator
VADGKAPLRYGLVVEDQPATRQWLADALREAFGVIEVAAFGTLAAGQAWVRARPPVRPGEPVTIALIDLVLPDGSGIALIREISDLHPGIAPVVISMFDDDTHLFEAMAAGAQGYLLKDERPEQLIEHIREIERGEPPLSPSVARRILSHFHKRAPAHASVGADALLTTREKEVLGLLGKGLRLSDAAARLGLTRHTVAGYVKVIYSKLNISSRAEAALEAMRRGLI